MEQAHAFMEELFGANWERDTGPRAQKVCNDIIKALRYERQRGREEMRDRAAKRAYHEIPELGDALGAAVRDSIRSLSTED